MILEEVDQRTLANMRLALEEICGRSADGMLQSHEARSYIAQAIFEGVQAGDRSFGEMLFTGRRALVRSDPIRTAITPPVDAVEAQPGFEPG